jgi:hypothetical protein
MSVSAFAADRIEGRVEGGGRPVAKADVTPWVTGTGAPQKLAETQTRDDGSFDFDGKFIDFLPGAKIHSM